jgi:hypothetical protein
MTLPRAQPIIPTWRKEPFGNPDWLFDFKYDGFRALCYLEQARCRLISRNGNALNRFNALGDQVALALEVDDAVIDGEVIAADESGRPQFYDLLRGTRAPTYVAFEFSGSTAPTFGHCRSASAGGPCGPSCQSHRRPFPSRLLSRAEVASSSN